MLDALVHGQDGKIPGAAKASASEHSLKIAKDPNIAVGSRVHAIDKIRAGKIQPLFGDFGRFEPQQRIGLCPQIGFNFPETYGGGHDVLLLYSRIPFDSMLQPKDGKLVWLVDTSVRSIRSKGMRADRRS